MTGNLAESEGLREMKAIHTRDEEQELQTLLESNHELLPGDQIHPEAPCRWLLIKREMSVPDPETGSNRWSLDFLFGDQHATPTFVECKRYQSSQARREVVGQLLEYAANGFYYWTEEELLLHAEGTANKSGRKLQELLEQLDPEKDLQVDE